MIILPLRGWTVAAVIDDIDAVKVLAVEWMTPAAHPLQKDPT